MLAAVGATEFAGMHGLAGGDDADVAAAGVFAIDRAIELDLEADEAAVGCRRRAEYVELRVHAALPCAVSAGKGVTVMVSCGTVAYFFVATRSTTRLSSATTIALIASSAAFT